MFEYLKHTADIKIRIKAKTDFELFSEICNAVNNTIFEKQFSKFSKQKILFLEAESMPRLIHTFIDEIVYLANYKHFTSKLINCSLNSKDQKYFLQCALVLNKVKAEDYKIEIKATSFNILYKENAIKKEKICEFIFDV